MYTSTTPTLHTCTRRHTRPAHACKHTCTRTRAHSHRVTHMQTHTHAHTCTHTCTYKHAPTNPHPHPHAPPPTHTHIHPPTPTQTRTLAHDTQAHMQACQRCQLDRDERHRSWGFNSAIFGALMHAVLQGGGTRGCGLEGDTRGYASKREQSRRYH